MAKKKPIKDITPISVKREKPEGYVFGRPTEYKPEYCQMLIDHMAEGYSFESFAGIIDTCNKTLTNWTHSQPDFLRAKELGVDKCRIWWEKQGKNGLFSINGVSINPTVFRMNMINRFKWKDKAEDDKKVTLDFENLSNDDLDQEIAKEEAKIGRAIKTTGRGED